jgi:Skp family chaperone for outer membrane proteins
MASEEQLLARISELEKEIKKKEKEIAKLRTQREILEKSNAFSNEELNKHLHSLLSKIEKPGNPYPEIDSGVVGEELL